MGNRHQVCPHAKYFSSECSRQLFFFPSNFILDPEIETTTPGEAKTEEKANPFSKAFTAQIIAKYMSHTKAFRGPDKHVTMHESLENKGEFN